jgi:hypothetical protein
VATGTWQAPPAQPGPTEVLPELEIPEPGSQRRLTVFFRWLLLIPQFLVVWALSVIAVPVVIVGWFGALALGRLPDPVENYLAGYVRYDTRVRADAMLLVDRYPPFAWDPEDYPVRVDLRAGQLNRLAVFFRLILMIPAAVVEALLTSGWYAAALVIWVIVLVLGRMPRPLFEATAATLRFTTRFSAYALMLTSGYPKRLFGDDSLPPLAAPRSATRPLLLSGAAKALVVVFLVLGLFSGLGSSFGSFSQDNGDSSQLRGRAAEATASATQAADATAANPLTAGSRP